MPTINTSNIITFLTDLAGLTKCTIAQHNSNCKLISRQQHNPNTHYRRPDPNVPAHQQVVEPVSSQKQRELPSLLVPAV